MSWLVSHLNQWAEGEEWFLDFLDVCKIHEQKQKQKPSGVKLLFSQYQRCGLWWSLLWASLSSSWDEVLGLYNVWGSTQSVILWFRVYTTVRRKVWCQALWEITLLRLLLQLPCRGEASASFALCPSESFHF